MAPGGPYQRVMSSGLVSASNTSGAGALKSRVTTASRSDGVVIVTVMLSTIVSSSETREQIVEACVERAHALRIRAHLQHHVAQFLRRKHEPLRHRGLAFVLGQLHLHERLAGVNPFPSLTANEAP